jgi:hypothetical protein
MEGMFNRNHKNIKELFELCQRIGLIIHRSIDVNPLTSPSIKTISLDFNNADDVFKHYINKDKSRLLLNFQNAFDYGFDGEDESEYFEAMTNDGYVPLVDDSDPRVGAYKIVTAQDWNYFISLSNDKLKQFIDEIIPEYLRDKKR